MSAPKKRGRPRGSGKSALAKLERERDFAVNALREILGARPLRDGIKFIGLSEERAGFDSMAFEWTQAYTAGMLKRLEEGSL